MEQTFINDWIEENQLLDQQYEKENYKVIDTGSRSKRCVIFFSGNGLYFPNDVDTFSTLIMQKDHYEWEKVATSKKIRTYYSRIIFIRDIYKQWYVKGISNENNSVEKVKNLLKELTRECQVTCVGNSSGGYMATLMGIKLGAKRIFDFSGQFCLKQAILQDENELLREFSSMDSCKENMDLIPLLKNNEVPVFYFYPAKCEQDDIQSKLVMPYLEKSMFAFEQNVHGKTVVGTNYEIIFTMSNEELQSNCIIGKNWSAMAFLMKTGGMTAVVRTVLGKIRKKLCRN